MTTVGLTARKAEREARPEIVIRAPSLSWRGVIAELACLRHYPDLLLTLSVHRVKVRYKQAVLGVAWAILQPLGLMLVYAAVFSLVVQMPAEGVAYPLFAYVGLLPWTYFSSALLGSCTSLVNNSALITKVYFPREILPVTYVIASLFDMLVASSVLVALLVFYGTTLTVHVLWVLPLLVLETALLMALGLAAAATQVYFRDLGIAAPLVLQLWMFATPVLYPLSSVPAWLRPLYVANPMVGIVEGLRRAVVHGAPPDVGSLAITAAVTAVLLPAAYVYFTWTGATLADRA